MDFCFVEVRRDLHEHLSQRIFVQVLHLLLVFLLSVVHGLIEHISKLLGQRRGT